MIARKQLSALLFAHASRTMSKSERCYHVTRKELLAVVFFIHHFRHYLVGKQFTPWTDHGCLRWWSNFRGADGSLAGTSSRVQLWTLFIAGDVNTRMQNPYQRYHAKKCGHETNQTVELEPQMVCSNSRTVPNRCLIKPACWWMAVSTDGLQCLRLDFIMSPKNTIFFSSQLYLRSWFASRFWPFSTACRTKQNCAPSHCKRNGNPHLPCHQTMTSPMHTLRTWQPHLDRLILHIASNHQHLH